MTTVFTLAGAGQPHPDMNRELRGEITASPNVHVMVQYPNQPSAANIDTCARMLDDALVSTPGPKVVFGYSEGGQGAYRWMQAYGPTSAVSPDELRFVIIGCPWRKYGGVPWERGRHIPEGNRYAVSDVARRFDGWANYPDDQSNSIAVSNAWLGMAAVHPFYYNVNINDPANVVYVEGNVRYVNVPTYPIPYVTKNNWWWPAWLRDKVYRPGIESAYRELGK